jgi:hypothetical protein
MTIAKSDVRALLGPIDEALVTDIIATGATPEELAQAWAWLNSDEALVNEGRPMPSGKVAELLEILASEADAQ